MSFRYLDLTPAQFDERIAANPDGGTMFALAEYGEAKAFNDWRPLQAECDGVTLLILERGVPVLGRVWVLPKGPGVTDPEQLRSLMPQIAAAARRRGVFFIRMEPEIIDGPHAQAVLREGGCVDAGFLQNNQHTIIADLSGSIDDVLARIPKKRRYDIRRAERDGVHVREMEPTDASFEIMWDLWREVLDDHHLTVRPKDYMFHFWRTYIAAGKGALFFAEVEGRPVAAVFAVTNGRKSIYKDGASVRNRPVPGASHYLQWKVIEWAHARGCTEHDLCASPPADRMDDPTHPYYGLGVFKRAFGDRFVSYVGAWDLPLKPRAYALWNAGGFGLWRRTVGRLKNDPYFF